jgi:hypothetical protein
MPVILTATVTARCWKQHTCCSCGCVYRYLLERTAKSSGGQHDDVRSAADQKIARKLRDDVEECPCPTCGTVQPDMVAKDKRTWHKAFAWITGVILALVILPASKGGTAPEVAGKIAAAVAGFGILGHLLTALSNPNRRPARNLSDAQARGAMGTLQMVRPGGTPEPANVPPNLTLLHAACLLAVCVAPFAFLAVVYVSEQHPLPVNAGLKPDVVGPGDEVTIPLDSSIRSVGGYWRAAARATVVNAAEVGAPATLTATSDREGWQGKTMVVKDRRDPFEPIQPWARVTIPDDAALGGKTLRLHLSLTVSYPVEVGKAGAAKDATVEKDVEIVLADAATQRLYRDTWQVGKWVGYLCCVLGGVGLVLLARRLQGQATPPQIVPLWAPGDGRQITGPSAFGPDEGLFGRKR